jgi:1-deoxy-D-xylulose-5-phosphate reductoisomerase
MFRWDELVGGDMSRRKVVILGSTGSIGTQALQVIRQNLELFEVVGLACNRNLDLLVAQAVEFDVPVIAVADRNVGAPTNLPSQTRLVRGQEALCEIAAGQESDVVVIATTGVVGLAATVAAIRQGKAVALASKELLVMTGSLLTDLASQYGALILPIDSEHSAIWQCLQGEDRRRVSRLILTASGGPFLDTPIASLAKVSPKVALEHPNWDMGPKVTIDSATLMNKGLEIIEARWLFGVPFSRIEVVIHPQSVVHSMIEFTDGAMKAQLGKPDMVLPITYALSYPDRIVDASVADKPLDLSFLNTLSFQQPDITCFPLLTLAREAGIQGGSMPAVLCGADLAAVQLYLDRKIGFLDISKVVADTIETADWCQEIGVNDVHLWHQHGHDTAMGIAAVLAS